MHPPFDEPNLVKWIAIWRYPTETWADARQAYVAELESKGISELLDIAEAWHASQSLDVQIRYLTYFAHGHIAWRTDPPPPEGVKAYESYLRGLTTAERSAHRMAVMRGEGPSQKDLEEFGRFFNLPSAAFCDSGRWAHSPTWTGQQAAAIALKRNPDLVNYENVVPFRTISSFASRYCDLYERMAQALTLGDIPPDLLIGGVPAARPARFVEWGKEWSVAFPADVFSLIPCVKSDAGAPNEAVSAEAKGAAQPEQQPQPAPDDHEEVKWRPLLVAVHPEPSLPFMDHSQLAQLFQGIRDKRGKKIDWTKETEKASRSRIRFVERDESEKPYRYNPEGVAMWLIQDPRIGADRRDVGAAMYEETRSRTGPGWDLKSNYWKSVENGGPLRP